jgi:transcription initiation factor TFIIE subunit beta
VEEDIIKYWRDVPVEGLDDEKIEEYLEKQGIASMKDAFAKSQLDTQPLKRKQSTKGRQSKKHNEHLGNILDEYNPDLIKK